jgi:DNA-binding IclR family transcriptional regulator
MTKNQVFRLLKTLESRRFVERADDGAYRVGMRALEIGQLLVRRLDVVRAARPYPEELDPKTGETVHLGILDDLEAVCVDRIRDRSGAIVAAVSVAGPTPRVRRKLHTEYRPLVVEAAARISASLGYAERALAAARS